MMKKAIPDLVRENPYLDCLLTKSYYRYLEQRIRIRTAVENLKREAPIHPFRIYWVDPDDISYKMPSGEAFSLRSAFPRVLDGSWDEELERVDEHVFAASFEMRFRDGEPWENTPLYETMLERISGGTDWKGRSSEEGLMKHLREIDDLHGHMKRNGYITQREIRKNSSGVPLENCRASVVNEIRMNIDREGRFIFDQGYHRFFIARLLGVDRIPVRVLIRHARWQETRRRAVDGSIRSHESHPDLRHLR